MPIACVSWVFSFADNFAVRHGPFRQMGSVLQIPIVDSAMAFTLTTSEVVTGVDGVQRDDPGRESDCAFV